MARFARIVASDIPHHITQRGNRRQPTFFREDDYAAYLDLLAELCPRFEVDIWAYCLMSNHVHLIAVPGSKESLALALGEVHKRYTRRINFREGWRGHLWQGRFASYPMDERHLLAAARYIERNPVQARMVIQPEDYPWSSARAHMSGQDDKIVKAAPLLEMISDWRNFLADPIDEDQEKTILRHEKTGRPAGAKDFISRLERTLGKILTKGRPGPRHREKALVN